MNDSNKSTSQLATDLKRLERKIDALTRMVKETKKPYWVKSGTITELTGWDNERMRREREKGELVWKYIEEGDEKGFWYDLNSIHPHLIKVKT